MPQSNSYENNIAKACNFDQERCTFTVKQNRRERESKEKEKGSFM